MFPPTFFIDIVFKPIPTNESENKNEVQWSQYINFCQKKLNEKLIKSKTNENPKTPPKFEIGSEISPISEKKEQKITPKEEQKKEAQKKDEKSPEKRKDEKPTETKKEEKVSAQEQLKSEKEAESPVPVKMAEDKKEAKSEERGEDDEEDVDDYIKKLESS